MTSESKRDRKTGKEREGERGSDRYRIGKWNKTPYYVSTIFYANSTYLNERSNVTKDKHILIYDGNNN